MNERQQLIVKILTDSYVPIGVSEIRRRLHAWGVHVSYGALRNGLEKMADRGYIEHENYAGYSVKK